MRPESAPQRTSIAGRKPRAQGAEPRPSPLPAGAPRKTIGPRPWLAVICRKAIGLRPWLAVICRKMFDLRLAGNCRGVFGRHQAGIWTGSTGWTKTTIRKIERLSPLPLRPRQGAFSTASQVLHAFSGTTTTICRAVLWVVSSSSSKLLRNQRTDTTTVHWMVKVETTGSTVRFREQGRVRERSGGLVSMKRRMRTRMRTRPASLCRTHAITKRIAGNGSARALPAPPRAQPSSHRNSGGNSCSAKNSCSGSANGRSSSRDSNCGLRMPGARAPRQPDRRARPEEVWYRYSLGGGAIKADRGGEAPWSNNSNTLTRSTRLTSHASSDAPKTRGPIGKPRGLWT